ncbi:hypothetical protein LZC95_18035 [Pendulispora brunnea]|uniref:Uncharacterized protein n=1 Tax=Pendulispora brunnea TaxID=2905690 RepID=A0ABZ2KJ71_9BACT
MTQVVRRISWLGLCVLAACSSQDDGSEQDDTALQRAEQTLGARLTPSNLPANTCDTPGKGNFNVPAGGDAVVLDTDAACDALVPQADGLPTICVRKFANVTIDGVVTLKGARALALVATRSMQLRGFIHGEDGANAPQPQGQPPAPSSWNGGGGGGHVTPGGGGGGGTAGGAAFGPTTGAALVPGSSSTGRGGGAVQVVSCGTLDLSGQISVEGMIGAPGITRPPFPGGATGGASAGTIVVEAARVTNSGNGRLVATGGNGGCAELGVDPCGCGLGGNGTRPPTDGIMPPGFSTGGGGGGAAGRIVINVPRGTTVPALASDPPAFIGVIGTH